jgi:hypothetical protein
MQFVYEGDHPLCINTVLFLAHVSCEAIGASQIAFVGSRNDDMCRKSVAVKLVPEKITEQLEILIRSHSLFP